MTGFEQLERQLIESVDRRHGWRVRMGGVAAWAALAAGATVAVAVAVVALLLVGHRTPTTPVSVGSAVPMVGKNPAMKYLLKAAEATRGQCGRATSTYLIGDLSILGVLRRPPTVADRLPPIRGNPSQGAYRPFIRRARSVDGVTYYLWPEVWPISGGAALVRHCAAAERRALAREHIPANLRAAARRGAARFFTTPTLYPGICLFELFTPPRRILAQSGCGETAQEIQRGGFEANPSRTFTAIVPDGVASVTLRYKNRSFTQRVINNLVAIRVTSEHRASYEAEIWRSSTGAVIKTITRPYP